MNLEQQLMPNVGFFARAGFADGNKEPYEFTDVDRTVAAGLSISGKQWGRDDDTFGFAGVVNGISDVHQAFLNAGGLGILVGDGMLPHPGNENIIETYYSFPVVCFEGHARLSAHRKSRLQSRPRPCFSFRRPLAYAVLAFPNGLGCPLLRGLRRCQTFANYNPIAHRFLFFRGIFQKLLSPNGG